MKTTVELPDELLTELKVTAARERRRLRDVMEEVLRVGLRVRRSQPQDGTAARERAEAWLHGWRDLGRRIEAAATDPKSTVDILLADRR
jgi:plasmid stability protein